MARGYGTSYVWRKLVSIREDVEHNIWRQVKIGNSSFWFDNWTRQGTLYYVEGENTTEDELEVRDFIENREWNLHKLRSKLFEEMVYYIVENIKPHSKEQSNDKPWWMGITP